MKLTKKSKLLMSFFSKNKYLNHIHYSHQTKKTNDIITELYKHILEAYNYLLSIKQKNNYYNVDIKKIYNISQISKPQSFNSNSFPDIIRSHIDDVSVSELIYTFSLFNRNIKVIFIVEDDNAELKMETYNNYVDSIILWLYILNIYASKQCVNNIVVYFYFTSLEKKLPDTNIHILDEINVNTAFTTTCPKDSEIVVFRKEEWFKVFIHETFHNFGLDFSDMNTNDSHNYILNIFPIKSSVNLYEAYTEFWAEIMNALFCSFFILKDKNNISEFLSNSEFFINFERTYSFFQLVKTLNFMGLTYKDLYSTSQHSKISRETLYKEKTNVLAYYIIKTILMNSYQSFMYWCKSNNFFLLQFNKTIANQKNFCIFIEKNYRTKSMLDRIENTQQLFMEINKTKMTNFNKQYILSNLRMSICELG